MIVTQSPAVDDLRKALAAAGPAWERDLVKAHREVGKVAANAARADARGGTPQQRREASAIGQSASKRGVKVTVGSPASAPFGRAVFWGAKRRVGWFAADKYAGSAGRQFPEWVGNAWRPAVKGEGPYVINDSLADHVDDIVDVYGKQMDQVAAALAARRVSSF